MRYGRGVFILSLCLALYLQLIIVAVGYAVPATAFERYDLAAPYESTKTTSIFGKIYKRITAWRDRNSVLAKMFLPIVAGSFTLQGLQAQAEDSLRIDSQDVYVAGKALRADNFEKLRGQFAGNVSIYDGDTVAWAGVCGENSDIIGGIVDENGDMHFFDTITYYLTFTHEIVHAKEDVRKTSKDFAKLRKAIGKSGSKTLKSSYIALEEFILENMPMDYSVRATYNPNDMTPLAREFYAYYYQFLINGWLDQQFTEAQKAEFGDVAGEFITLMQKFHKALSYKQNLQLRDAIVATLTEMGLDLNIRIVTELDLLKQRLIEEASDSDNAAVVNEAIYSQSA
ncbi:MAG: hypothetical protein JW938_07010 [Candidatus Omnitrophica bacterium]|nr:hypothetical protein [Candidatus Omnitrophota bacterium]